MALRLCADRVAERRQLLPDVLECVGAVCRAEREILEAFGFGFFRDENYRTRKRPRRSRGRETTFGLVDPATDLKLAPRSAVGIDLVVVTPLEYAATFRNRNFGRTVLAQARRVYAA